MTPTQYKNLPMILKTPLCPLSATEALWCKTFQSILPVAEFDLGFLPQGLKIPL